MLVIKLESSITPLIKGLGSDPWTNSSFVSGDLTINGLLGNGSSKYLSTGLTANIAFPSDTDVGITCYISVANNAGSNIDVGASQGSNFIELCPCYAGTCYWDCFDTGGSRVSATNTSWVGYTSGNRIASNNTAVYQASSTVTHNTLVSGSGSGGTRPTANAIFAFARNNDGYSSLYSSHRLSFVALHRGLTATDSATFFNTIQTLRQNLGGGYV